MANLNEGLDIQDSKRILSDSALYYAEYTGKDQADDKCDSSQVLSSDKSVSSQTNDSDSSHNGSSDLRILKLRKKSQKGWLFWY